MGTQYKYTNQAWNEIQQGEYDIPDLNPKTVLDIGANEGAFTAWVTQRFPGCRIYAYEPMPQNAELFLENHSENKRVIFTQAAVHDGKPVRMFFGNNSGCCSMYDIGEQKQDGMTVNSVVPSDLPACEFIKVDTEGNELVILNGLDYSQAKWIATEFHRDGDVPQILSLMESKGFRMCYKRILGPDRGILTFKKREESNTKSVFLAMPVYRWADALTMQAMMKFMAEWYDKGGFSLSFKLHVGECPIGRARNELTQQFLKSDASHILFVDSDIIFSHEQVKKLLDDDVDIVGGVYVMKKEGPVHPICNTLNEVTVPDENGLLEMKNMGTGFLLIHRRVFEKMIEAKGPELEYISDSDGKTVFWDFWRMGVYHDVEVNRRRWLSEDWQFCTFARECGFKVWMDGRVVLNHSGMAIYPLSYQVKQLFAKEKILGIADKTAPEPVAGPSSPARPVTD